MEPDEARRLLGEVGRESGLRLAAELRRGHPVDPVAAGRRLHTATIPSGDSEGFGVAVPAQRRVRQADSKIAAMP
jgi:hypothetical protein